MILTLIRFAVLVLILWNLPAFSVTYLGSTVGSLTSYASSFCLMGYFVLSKRDHRPLLPFVFLGILYFSIGGFNYTELDNDNFFIKEFVRFMIVVVCGQAVLRHTKEKEIYCLLLIGAASIVINAVFLPFMQPARFGEHFGRFSGLYLNPNLAGGVCLLGYCLSFSFKDLKWKLIGQILFTLGGILTFSRTFILIWLLISMISIYNNKKNVIAPMIGALTLILIFTFSGSLTLNADRFGALQSILGQGNESIKVIGEDTRSETWANYYDLIFDKPFFGNGYLKFQKKGIGLPGVHNSFLLVIGEAGIIPFLLLIGIYSYLLFKSYYYFKSHPWYFYMTFSIVLSMMTGHGYFYNFITVFFSMYIFIKLWDISLRHPSDLKISKPIDH